MQAGPDVDVLEAAAHSAIEYARSIAARRITPDEDALVALAAFDEPLPDVGADPVATLRLLDDVGSPATIASSGARYFGFVTGAVYPVALGTSWLASAWDQNAGLSVMSPVATKLHDVVRRWLVDLLGLPADTGLAFVTGATVANAACLAAARDALLATLGWDVQSDGLFGAPPLDVVVGEGAHSTLKKSLGLVGLGRRRVHVVPADDQGRLRADLLPDLDGPVLICAQAGEVNTGAFDPFDEIADWLAQRTGWLHVDARVRPLGAGRPEPCRSRARPAASRFMGDRRPQVAQRHVRLRAGLRPPCRRPAPHVHGDGGLPARRRDLRRDAPHAAVVTARPPARGLGGPADARPRRHRRARRTATVVPRRRSPSGCATKA